MKGEKLYEARKLVENLINAEASMGRDPAALQSVLNLLGEYECLLRGLRKYWNGRDELRRRVDETDQYRAYRLAEQMKECESAQNVILSFVKE